VTGAGELRAKESDRITAAVDLLAALGAEATATADGFIVTGGARYRAARTESHGDHRIAMTAAIAATAADGPVEVGGFEASGVSWPEFAEVLEATWSSR
jgi:3-phosphoshikimate 1-carboxyvinyltransferase